MTENKTVVITGGGKGIGAAISRAFHGAGYSVVIGSRSDSGLDLSVQRQGELPNAQKLVNMLHVRVEAELERRTLGADGREARADPYKVETTHAHGQTRVHVCTMICR